MGMKISPTTRAGPGLSMLILDRSCALAGVPAPSPEALARGGDTEPLGLSVGGLPRCPQGPCHRNRRSPRAGRTADAARIWGGVDSEQDHPQAALRKAGWLFPLPCTTLCVNTIAHLFPVCPALPYVQRQSSLHTNPTSYKVKPDPLPSTPPAPPAPGKIHRSGQNE